MSDFDAFAIQLLEESKRFLEKAQDAEVPAAEAAYLHGALMLSFCALEAQVNSIGEEFSNGSDLSVHERGLILERNVRLENGAFELQSSLKVERLEDRIEFLHAKFSGKPIDKSQKWWGQLAGAIQLRNKLTHPKTIPEISQEAVRSAIRSIIGAIHALYRAIYKRDFPPVGRDLNSNLTF